MSYTEKFEEVAKEVHPKIMTDEEVLEWAKQFAQVRTTPMEQTNPEYYPVIEHLEGIDYHISL